MVARDDVQSPHQKFDGDPRDPAAFAKYSGTDYAIDAMTDEAVRFLEARKDDRFFLYFAPTHPDVVQRIERVMRQRARSTIERWNF